MLTMVLRVIREKAVKDEMEKQSWPNSRLRVRLSEINSSSIRLSIVNEGDDPGGGVGATWAYCASTCGCHGSLTTLEISSLQTTPSPHNLGYNFPMARRQQMSHI